jgi:hypothetical protein
VTYEPIARTVFPAEDERSPWLPDEVWDAHPRLGAIRDAAHARQRSPDAVLHVCLARVAAMVPYTLTIPPIVGAESGLSYFAALLGVPGVGKTSALYIGSDVIPATAALVGPVPLGTGEGLVEVMFEKVQLEGEKKPERKQTKHHVLVYADEGDALQALGARSGATINSTLRTIWTGHEIGSTNADVEKRRLAKARTYTYGLVLGVQVPAAGALLANVSTGLPQRFGWALATHPDIPPATGAPRPIEGFGWRPPKYATLSIADSIVAEVRAADLARVRGSRDTAELDAHEDLLRLKVAALLAVLCDEPLDATNCPVTVEHWELAGMVKRASDAARAYAVTQAAAHDATVEDANAQRLGRRQATADEVAESHKLTKTVDVARALAGKVWDQPDGWTAAALRRSLPNRDRGYCDAALAHAEAEEWLALSEQPGQGRPKVVVRPGSRRPS